LESGYAPEKEKYILYTEMEKPICQVHQLGLVEYPQAKDLQDRLADEIAAGNRPPTLLLLEHPHTYTFGRRGRIDNLLWDQAELERRGIATYWVDRGGDVTYHGPGQLVGYPLLPLAAGGLSLTASSQRIPQADYVGYLRRLEQTLILALANFNVDGRQVTGMTGVWVNLPDRTEAGASEQTALAKIAAIGVKIDARGISRHGFALNVNPDMSYWQGIIGCGLAGYQVTSLAEVLDEPPTMQAVRQAVIRAFGYVFQYEMVESSL